MGRLVKGTLVAAPEIRNKPMTATYVPAQSRHTT